MRKSLSSLEPATDVATRSGDVSAFRRRGLLGGLGVISTLTALSALAGVDCGGSNPPSGSPPGDASLSDAPSSDSAPLADSGSPSDAGSDALSPDSGTLSDASTGDGATPSCCAVGQIQCASATAVETCGPSSGACPAWSVTACPTEAGATPYVCERNGAPSCVDPAWAEWPMPNSPVDVEAGAPTPQSFTAGLAGTVLDNVTGLMWEVTPTFDGVTFPRLSWNGALAYCASLDLAGYQDWRLPTIIELQSIVDYTVTGTSINATYFPGTPGVSFWSSTPTAGAGGTAWSIAGGLTQNQTSTSLDQNSAVAARCVR